MIRVAAVADLHVKVADRGGLAARFHGVNGGADVLLLPGDLTDNGLVEEAEVLLEGLGGVRVPVAAVLGNHDYAARKVDSLCAFLLERGVTVLDGQTLNIKVREETLGIVGARGFRGGFGEHALTETYEPEVAAWVEAAEREAAKVERGLRELREIGVDYRLVMLHYAPIRATVQGEAPETIPFYGSSRLCTPIDRHKPDLVVHGHSHYGTHQGLTPGGVPVCNVSAKVIGTPYVVLELGR